MYAKVSFRMTSGEQPLMLIPTHINSCGPFDFIHDTGAGVCLLSPELARTLSIRTPTKKEGAGFGGKVEIPIGSVSSISVGSASVGHVTVGVTGELERIGTCCGTKVHGVLGYNFFRDFKMRIDYTRRILALHRGQIYPDTEGNQNGTKVAFQLAHPSKPLAVIPVFVNGSGPHAFVLDTGASMSVLSSRLAEELGVASVPAPDIGGAGGMTRASIATLNKVKVGAAELENVGVVVSEFLSQLSQVVGTELQGIVGYNFLSNFQVTIDYPGAVIGLTGPLVS